MSLDYNTIRTAFVLWLDKMYFLAGVAWQYENAPRFVDPYFTLYINQVRTISYDYVDTTSSEVPTNYGDRELTLTVNIFKERNGLAILERLNSSLYWAEIRNHFADSGLFYINTDSMLDATTLLDTNYESRAIMRLRFRYSNQGVTTPEGFETGLIEEVEPIDYNLTGG